MPKPTKKEIREHKSFLRRQNRYEKKYARLFLRFLENINKGVAERVESSGLAGWESVLNDYDIQTIYEDLYKRITLKEAEISYNATVKPLLKESGQKDMIDDLAGILRTGNDRVNVWRNLLNNFIEVRILKRISLVNETTKERLTEIIQKGLDEGYGSVRIAEMIRNDTDYNQNRSLNIARTETVTAMNQGKFLAAQSSPFVMEKRWIPVNGPRTRFGHILMLDSPFIDMSSFFWVLNAKGIAEKGLYPGSETFSASNTCNCRCSISLDRKSVV